MEHSEALAILDDLCQFLDGKRASTNRIRKRMPRREAADPAWWMANTGTCPPWDGPRTVAYLAAYVRIAGPSFDAAGIRLDDGFLYPDRAVIRSLLQANCLRFRSGRIELTETGRALVAPMVRLESNFG